MVPVPLSRLRGWVRVRISSAQLMAVTEENPHHPPPVLISSSPHLIISQYTLMLLPINPTAPYGWNRLRPLSFALTLLLVPWRLAALDAAQIHSFTTIYSCITYRRSHCHCFQFIRKRKLIERERERENYGYSAGERKIDEFWALKNNQQHIHNYIICNVCVCNT